MQSFPLTGARALRLLTLSSALTLAACGGGGGESVSEAPVSTAVEITASNQQSVAADAGTIVTSLNPSAALFSLITLIPPTAMSVQALPAPVPMGNTSALLAAAARKFAPAATAPRLAQGVTTTLEVDCTSGSGTIEQTEPVFTETSYVASISVSLDACRTNLSGSDVLMNGTLKISLNSSEGSGYYDLLATQYTVEGDGFISRIDGDMRITAGPEGTTTSGTRLTTTTGGTRPEVVITAETQVAPRTVTLRNYRQFTRSTEGAMSTETTASVETNAFGAVATYELSTPEALVFTDMFIAGQLKVVGRNNVVLLITALGDGTFKLQRDDNGDGSIDATVSPLTASELNLSTQNMYPL